MNSCEDKSSTKSNDTSVKNLDISMYEEPKEGFDRFVIFLDKFENEDDFRVEIFGEKKYMADCNTYSLRGQFETKSLKGWGYSYYNFKTNGMIFGTRMACKDKTTKEKYVASQPYTLNYNSKLPIVVYVPKGIRISYNIWKKDAKNHVAKKQ